MGKTKTMFVEGVAEKEKSGKEAYEEKMRKKAEALAASPEGSKVKGIGLKGGDKIKKVSDDTPVVIEESKKEEVAEEAPVSENKESKKEKKLKVRSKNYRSAKSKVDTNRNYSLVEAIKLLKEISYSKFEETVEMHFVVRTIGLSTNLTLPHSGGKEKRIEVADEKTVEKLKSGKIDFDMLLATADMMPKLVPFARVLGPKGLMPNPKNGTLIKQKSDADKFSGATLYLKTEKEAPVIHTVVGKLKQDPTEIEDNCKAVLNAFPKQVVKAYIKSTMSPSLKLSV